MTKNLNKEKFFRFSNKNYFIFILILFSFLINFYSGYRGVFPIDSFLIYDGGYKVLNGYYPFKDYWSITGPLLDYVQSIFFFLFDVNWFSYVLHAALVNVIFTLFIFNFLIKFGLEIFYSFLYALSVSILAYPSIGTPFMDHHSAIFSMMSICSVLLAILEDKKSYWFFSGILLVISFFSKQIPSAYLIISIIPIILLNFLFLKNRKISNLFYFLLGNILSIATIFIIFLVTTTPFENFFVQYFMYPISLGNIRIESISFDVNNVFFQFKYIYLSFLPLFFLFFILLAKKINNILKKDLLILLTTFLTMLIFIYCQIITKNQILIFFLIPIYLGLSHIYIKKYLNKKIIINFIILFLVLSTAKYHLRFNYDKKFMDLEGININNNIDASILSKSIKGLRWITPKYKDNPVEELNMLIELNEVIKRDKKNKIIVTDYQILSSISNNKTPSPNKWYDDLSVPTKKNPFFKNYKNFYLNRIKKNNVENIYVIGSGKYQYIKPIFENPDCLLIEELNNFGFLLNISNCKI